MRGTQNQFKFLPDQYSDFPYPVFAEEWGFVGGLVLLGLYGILSIWAIRVASQSKDRFGAALSIGIGAMIFWQAIINLGMVLGLLPVVGVPLPLFSSGGSSVMTMLIGVGLLMNHADVPKGTTVVGVDIGDEGKEQAVTTLDKALGDRTTAPLNLTIGSHKLTLKPSIAGLSIDTDATVRGVAHPDYNPVSVIGSLFGQTRVADPVIVVDEDKLTAALKEVSGENGTATEGMVRFEPNKIVPVPGKAGTSLDVNAAASQVSAAYRTRAQTGADAPIDLKVTTVQPKVTQAELDSAVNGFAKRAMSNNITVSAGGVHTINFGPEVSLPQVLTMVADANGKLQPHIDTAVLKTLYGATFDGVLIKRADGSKTAVTPEDVAAAMIPALDSTTDRSVTLANVVS